MSKDNINDPESPQFWSTLLQSLSDSDNKDDLYPEINNPISGMSTSIAIDAPLTSADKMRTTTEETDKNSHEDAEKSNEYNMEEDAKEVRKILGKRARNESRNMAEKRRRTEIRTKIQKLKQMLPSCTKKEMSSTLDSIIDYIRMMKLYVESQSVGPMMPLGMRMDFPAPWFPFIPPNLFMPNYNGFTTTQGETSYDTQITYKDFNNQQQSSKSS